ncbi:putative eukaryotic initiation factor 4a [Leishmania major strain Friedlin]|uniref:Putative eukaryotic initiation factor 4a n=1 Tax=Leishmania major TaxID=5664 RepID=Q4Q0F4_LEIMA|nr:putative eukaryotic initiation factor 4a [Leishmania major strain Friedlin]CAG9584161.1 eukaryotic_translation_initation_factor_4_gamma_-_putative [Leishmania major strain Friedlin]CAJ09581.1 putative eukaryotic initiation factor 4a [Leishmania major strain Friedlin]|eukprot:XP_001687194.1 putative eukaryotic initiation factor 4a [Leishmania major strain Friedlin]
MLFNLRGIVPQKEEKVKNQMTLADILAFRDTWTAIPEPNFSLERVLLTARLEKQRKAEIPKLVTSENGFRVRDKKDMDASELELRRVQGSLNKLTDKNFDAVVEEALSPDLVLNPLVLKGAVDIIFNKAMAEPVFSGIYAQLCQRIKVYEQDLVAEAAENPTSELGQLMAAVQAGDEDQKNVNGRVRNALVKRCQEFHDSFVKQPPPRNAEAEEQLRKRNMANIKFVGELYMRSLISHRVILAVCSTALVLGFIPSPKLVTTDADLEMMVSLMNVIGKRFDENAGMALNHVPKDAAAAAHPHDTIWRALNSSMNDPRFSRRIRFLIQNLLEWRNDGWKPKESPAQGSSGGSADDSNNTTNNDRSNHRSSNNACNHSNTGGFSGPNEQMHRNTAPNNFGSGGSWQQQMQQQHSGGRGPIIGSSNAGGNRGGTRPPSMADRGDEKYGRGGGPGGLRQGPVSSFNDLSQFPASNDHMMPPPPPFAAPPPPFPGEGIMPPSMAPQAASAPGPQMSDEDRKLMALSTPPKCVDADLSSRILSCIRDAHTDGDWAAAGKAIVEAVPQDAAHMCRMCAVFVIAKKVTETSSEADRELFMNSLNSGMFDIKELTRGYSWCLTSAVAYNVKEDFPKVYSRFVACVTATKSMDFLSMVSNVMARTANYLDALYVPLEGAQMEWEEDFLEVWTSVLGKWREAHPGDKSTGSDILNCIASIKQRPFMKDIVSDFMMELSQQGYLDDAETKTWIRENRTNEKYKVFVDQMEQMYPDTA